MPMFDLPSGRVADQTAAVHSLIDGDRIHAEDRAAVVKAILKTAKANRGVVDPNMCRALIPAHVYPRVIGAVYFALVRKGVLIPHGWTVNDDTKSGNSGRPARRYRIRTLP